MITEGGQQFTTFVFGRRFQCFPKRGLFREIDLKNEKMNVKNGTTHANHAKNVLRAFVIGKELGAF
jgi:hypothetical protein